MAATNAQFQKYLQSAFSKSESLGLVAIEVRSGNLHKKIGGYPGTDHRMPMCCEVLYKNMKSGDSIVSQPKSGKGASVVVRYKLPR